jgi:hypothetical protein
MWEGIKRKCSTVKREARDYRYSGASQAEYRPRGDYAFHKVSVVSQEYLPGLSPRKRVYLGRTLIPTDSTLCSFCLWFWAIREYNISRPSCSPINRIHVRPKCGLREAQFQPISQNIIVEVFGPNFCGNRRNQISIQAGFVAPSQSGCLFVNTSRESQHNPSTVCRAARRFGDFLPAFHACFNPRFSRFF